MLLLIEESESLVFSSILSHCRLIRKSQMHSESWVRQALPARPLMDTALMPLRQGPAAAWWVRLSRFSHRQWSPLLRMTSQLFL